MEAAGYNNKPADGRSTPVRAPTSQDPGLQFNFVMKKSASFYPSALSSLACRFLSFVVVQSPGCISLFVTPWTAAHQAPLSSTASLNLLKFMSIESVMLSNRLILCCPLLLLPSVFPSIRVFVTSWFQNVCSRLHIFMG